MYCYCTTLPCLRIRYEDPCPSKENQMAIETVDFFIRDEHGKRIYDPKNTNGRGPSAHWFCYSCGKNYSGLDITQVNQSAEAHSLLHVKRIYTPDPEFRRMN